MEPTQVNGRPGALIRSAEGAVVSVWALEFGEQGIVALRSIVNPDKLRHIPGAADFGEWLRRATPSREADSKLSGADEGR